jgi:hypothetical protein
VVTVRDRLRSLYTTHFRFDENEGKDWEKATDVAKREAATLFAYLCSLDCTTVLALQ